MPQDERIGKGKVALVFTRNREEGVRKAISLLGVNPMKGKRITLKPNFNTADPCPGSTHNDTLKTLILMLKEMGADEVTIAERSGPADTQEVMEEKGIFRMAKELGFKTLNLERLKEDSWVMVQPEGSHWRRGFRFAKIYREAECIVSTCCLKTHSFGGHFTLSLKNSVGMVSRNDMGELHGSRYQREMIAEMNTAYTPALVVLDGIEAFVRGGPMQGARAFAGMVLAGSDRIAIDATGVAALRHLGTTPEVSRGSIFSQDQIKRAVELGLGVASPKEIAYITNDAKSRELAERLKEALLKE